MFNFSPITHSSPEYSWNIAARSIKLLINLLINHKFVFFSVGKFLSHLNQNWMKYSCQIVSANWEYLWQKYHYSGYHLAPASARHQKEARVSIPGSIVWVLVSFDSLFIQSMVLCRWSSLHTISGWTAGVNLSNTVFQLIFTIASFECRNDVQVHRLTFWDTVYR